MDSHHSVKFVTSEADSSKNHRGKKMQKRIEKDFEAFLRGLTKLEPVEFCGLARMMGVKMDKVVDDKRTMRPLEKIMEELMDKFLETTRRRQKEILKLLKDARRGK